MKRGGPDPTWSTLPGLEEDTAREEERGDHCNSKPDPVRGFPSAQVHLTGGYLVGEKKKEQGRSPLKKL